MLTHVGVNLSLGYRHLHVPSVTKKDHSVTLRVTWVNNYKTASVSLLDWMKIIKLPLFLF